MSRDPITWLRSRGGFDDVTVQVVASVLSVVVIAVLTFFAERLPGWMFKHIDLTLGAAMLLPILLTPLLLRGRPPRARLVVGLTVAMLMGIIYGYLYFTRPWCSDSPELSPQYAILDVTDINKVQPLVPTVQPNEAVLVVPPSIERINIRATLRSVGVDEVVSPDLYDCGWQGPAQQDTFFTAAGCTARYETPREQAQRIVNVKVAYPACNTMVTWPLFVRVQP